MADYPWQRFWHPATTELKLSEDGFLPDPNEQWTSLVNSDVVSLSALTTRPCVILLGEAGLGKTTVIREDVAQTQNSADCKRVFFDLKDYGSDFALHLHLFQAPVIRDFANGSFRLDLYLDSFDEAQLELATLGGFLLQELRKLDRSRLFIRIACRPASWPESFEQELRELFDNVQVFRLCPLRLVDVELAAKTAGINSQQFLEMVEQRHAMPFARKPLTLEFLLKLYLRDRSFPDTNVELFREGCLALCTEKNQSRQEKLRLGVLTPANRLAIAEMLAAVTIFCNRNTVPWSSGQEELSTEELLFKNISGEEKADGKSVPVNDRTLRETLDTALFDWVPQGRAKFGHRSLAEFLAASYLMRHKIEAKQIEELLNTQAGGERRVVPQLAETAAWVSNMYPEIKDEILRVDPMVLLRSDVAVLSNRDKKELVNGTLRLVERDLYSDRFLDRDLTALANDALADQLRAYLIDKKRPWSVRRFAMDVLQANGVSSLDSVLVSIAKDENDPMVLRSHALSVIAQIGADTAKAELRDFIAGSDDDPEDELKGWALSATWPRHISATDLFAVLTLPKARSYFGSYAAFLYELAESLDGDLSPADVPAALQWCLSVPHQPDGERLGEVVDSVVRKAWSVIQQNPEVPNLLARVVARSMHEYLPFLRSPSPRPGKVDFAEMIRSDSARRRALLTAMIRVAAENSYEPAQLFYSGYGIASEDDLCWLVEQIPHMSSVEKEFTCKALESLQPTKIVLDALYTGVKSAILPETFRRFLYVEFGSGDMRAQRHGYAMHLVYNVRAQRRRKRPTVQPPPRERVETALARAESGNQDWWVQLTREMTLKGDSTHYDVTDADLTTLPGWAEASLEIRGRIVRTADIFVSSNFPVPDTFIGRSQFPSSVLAGHQALALLLSTNRALLESKPANFWERWMLFLLWYPFGGDYKIGSELLGIAVASAPYSAVAAALTLTSADREDLSRAVRKLKRYWSPELGNVLGEAVVHAGIDEDWTAGVINELVEHRNISVITLLLEIVRSFDVNDPKQLASAVKAASALIGNAAPGSWARIWPRISENNAFGRTLVENLAVTRNTGFLTALNEEEAAEFLIWMLRQYPVSEDPKHDGAYTPSTRDQVAALRNAVPRYLVAVGTSLSVEALKRVYREVPEADWMKWHEQEARNNALKNAWRPMQPAEMRNIAAKADMAREGHKRAKIVEISIAVLCLLGPIFVPASLILSEKTIIGVLLGLIVIFLFEVPDRKRSTWFPLIVILLSSAVIAPFLVWLSHLHGK